MIQPSTRYHIRQITHIKPQITKIFQPNTKISKCGRHLNTKISHVPLFNGSRDATIYIDNSHITQIYIPVLLEILVQTETPPENFHLTGCLSNQKEHTDTTTMEKPRVAVIMVPFPAQGHLNQLMQLSCLISSYGIPVHYVGSAIHNRQAKVRINGLKHEDVEKIHFHDIPTPSFVSPPPDPNSPDKCPTQLQPLWDSLSLREPVASYLRDMANKFERVVVVHDSLMAVVVQDVSSILNTESYVFNCTSAFTKAVFSLDLLGKPLPIEHPKELPSFEGCIADEIRDFLALQFEPLSYRAGDLYNTCRLIEQAYMELIEKEEIVGSRKSWAIGPILPAKISSSANQSESHNRCLEWLDKQEINSVIYVSFGTTTSLSDEQIKELAYGLEQSKVKFLWVLRDADKRDIFDGQVRRAELPDGFEERVEGVGMVVREWAPQPQILAHPSTGGFVSHCGWNSCIESITMGVPIAAWPMHSDQPSNSVLITEILKMGLFVRDWKQRTELVKASTIENVLKILMASKEGDELRKRAEELAATVQQATQQGGASKLELDSFISHITRGNDI